MKKASYLPKNLILAIGVLLTISSCTVPKEAKGQHKSNSSDSRKNNNMGLKDYYAKYFSIGVAVNIEALTGPEAALITKEFNSITAENDMKMGPIHPKENVYDWSKADAIISFAEKNHIMIRGHNLLWHNQAPDWFFKDRDGKQASKELVFRRLKDHINTVVKRYKGKVYAWDVVNEAVDDSPNTYLRNSKWYQICGEEFIAKAFEYAHDADPDAALYYNDYNSEYSEKRDKIYKLMKSLVDAKVPINGVGLQGHWKLSEPSPQLIRTAIEKYASLGLKLQITELDITIRSKDNYGLDNGKSTLPVDSGLTVSLAQRQADRYREIFEIFRQYHKVITNVTFWNISDRYSWLDSREGGLAGGAAAGEQTNKKLVKAYPLLFDEEFKRKKAYWSVVDFKD